MKREIPILLTILCGLLITVSFFAPQPNPAHVPPIEPSIWQAMNSELLEWAEILIAVAFILGISNLFRINLKQIAARHEDRHYKVVLLITMVGFFIVGMAEIHTRDLAEHAPGLLRALVPEAMVPLKDGTQLHGYIDQQDETDMTLREGPELVPRKVALASIDLDNLYRPGWRDWIYQRFFLPLQATMFSLLAFYVASAAFRAFRARSMEATLLLLAGSAVMLGQVPLGDQITGGYAGRIMAFLMVYVSQAGVRAIIIGGALGVLATGLRIVLGIERGYLSE